MDSSNIISSQQKEEQAILIVDKHGFFGERLISHINGIVTSVLVSDKEPDKSSNIIHINGKVAVPQIPDAIYTHMVFVWEKEVEEWLHPFLQKAGSTNAKCLIVIQHEKLHEVSSLAAIKESASMLVIGDVFGREVTYSPLDVWIQKAKQTKKIVLENMGLITWYPVEYADVVEVTIRTLFSHLKKGEIFFACSEHIYTSLSLTYALQKVDPYIQVDLQTTESHDTGILPKGEYLLDRTYSVIEKIQHRYKEIISTQKNEEAFFSENPKKQTIRAFRKKRRVPFLLYGIFVFLIMPIVIFAGSGGLGVFFLQSGIKDMENGRVTPALQKITASQECFQLSLTASQIVSFESVIVGQQASITTLADKLQTAETITEGLVSGIQAYQKLLGVLLGQTLTPKEDAIAAVNTLKATIQTFQGISDTSIPKIYQPTFATYKEVLDEISSFADVLPGITGAGEDRTYAILFQNNMELRPGGGFIGSYGIVKLHNGKFESFTIHDVYDSDGQLKGHVEPPFAIRRYIPIVHLFLRDSNFDVDATNNAKEEAFLLNQETGESVDGVFAVDLSFVRALLSLTGGIYVPSYNQTVTKDNFFLLTEQHAEKNFFPGSSQKKDFLNTFFYGLLQKLETNHIQLSKNSLELLLSSAKEKHVLLSFANPTIQEPFTYSGYSSSLWDNRSDNPQIINDFLGINEANLGINKANYFVKRTVAQKVLVNDKGEVNEAVSVTYTNSSKKGEWPGGVYRNYIRFILPLNSVLKDVLINNQSQNIVSAITDPKIYEAPYFVTPKGLEVEKTEEEGKTIYGFLITVPEGGYLTVSLAYQLGDTVSLKSQSAIYSLKLFKQPGTDSIPYLLDVAYPKSFLLLSGTKGFTTSNSVVEWKANVTRDIETNIPFITQ